MEELSMATMTTGVNQLNNQINAQISSVEAVLEGGPETIPTASRIREVNPLDEKVKLPYYGGYEHFERVGSLVEDPSCRQVIFRWTMRTELAE
jgi:Family of unknown function (DUF5988)